MDPEVLKIVIAKALKDKNLSVSEAEKRANLGNAVLRNFLLGPKKNLTLKTLKALSQVLGFSLEDLESNLYVISEAEGWNYKLFSEVSQFVHKFLEDHKVYTTNKDAFNAVKEIYYFSYKNQKNQIDQPFSEWYLNKNFKNRRLLTAEPSGLN